VLTACLFLFMEVVAIILTFQGGWTDADGEPAADQTTNAVITDIGCSIPLTGLLTLIVIDLKRSLRAPPPGQLRICLRLVRTIIMAMWSGRSCKARIARCGRRHASPGHPEAATDDSISSRNGTSTKPRALQSGWWRSGQVVVKVTIIAMSSCSRLWQCNTYRPA
jgi:hypothetical protein